MGSFPLQTIVNTWQRFNLFFKACTKGYVSSQLILANPDNKLVNHSTATLTSDEHLEVWLCPYNINITPQDAK